MYKYLLVIFLVTGFAFTAMAQKPETDTTKQSKTDRLNLKHDSVTSKRFAPKVTKEKTYHPDSLHSPHKAVMRSLIIPGWGQIYNHQWWKVPVIYAGLGLLADVIIFNQRQYGPNLIVARYYERGTPLTPGMPQYALYKLYLANNLPAQSVYDIVDSYDRDRDLGIFGLLGGWGIQMVDAYVQAKFQHSYTMDTDFSFKFTPTIINGQPLFAGNLGGAIIPGLKITFMLQ
jgi:hypothetical protein